MNEYNYSYQVGLTTVRKDIPFDFTTDMLGNKQRVEDFIRLKINEFSNMSRNSLRNSKYVEMDSVRVFKDSISFTIYSENELPVVGKCIRLLSQLLLTEQYFVDLLLNRKLFKTYIPTEKVNEETGKVEAIDVSDAISDSDFVKALIDYLLTPQYPYTKEKNEISNGIKEMKAIAVKTGMIKL